MPFPLLIDMAIHQFDLARDLTGSEPVAVYCNSYNPSWSWYAGDAAAQVLFEFASGSRFSFSGSWCSPGLETSWNGEWRVSGEGGSAVWDGDHEPTAADGNGQPIAATIGDEPEQIAGSLAEFLGVLESGAIPSGEAHSNVLSLAMVEAAIKSAGDGRRVLIADILDDAHAEAVRTESDPQIKDGPGVLEFGPGSRGAARRPQTNQRPREDAPVTEVSAAQPPRPLRVGMIGYAFMGAVHAQAWRNAHRFFHLAHDSGAHGPGWP